MDGLATKSAYFIIRNLSLHALEVVWLAANQYNKFKYCLHSSHRLLLPLLFQDLDDQKVLEFVQEYWVIIMSIKYCSFEHYIRALSLSCQLSIKKGYDFQSKYKSFEE